MRAGWTATLMAGALLCAAMPASAQPPRADVWWARSTAGQPITLDGRLDEPAWAAAETKTMKFAYNSGLPGSGWKNEGPPNAVSDSMSATIKFLYNGNQLYMGAVVQDKSIGGSSTFNRFDGFLMSIKNHNTASRPTPPAEYLYSWWYPDLFTPQPTTHMPSFIGEFGTHMPSTVTRTQAQIDAWDARTIVRGTQNSDAAPDTSYTVEMRFDVSKVGYNIAGPSGGIVEWNLSIYDCDWFWPNQPTQLSSNRTWWQGPWGNASAYNEVKIYCRPEVTIYSPTLPDVGPDQTIPNAANYATPTIDGLLNDAVWAKAPSFDIRYGDAALRNSYPGAGPWRSGQFQPTVNNGQAAVVDPCDATIKYFVKGNKFYIGFDARDQVVQSIPYFDRWDGFIVSVPDRDSIGVDHNFLNRRLTFRIAANGTAKTEDYLAYLADSLHGANCALVLKPGTTLDTLGTSADVGYTAELELDLTKLGYPSGLGDRMMWWSVDALDGDSFTPFTDSYGTRTWWFREYEFDAAPVAAYMNPVPFLTGVEPEGGGGPGVVSLLGAFPNPTGAGGRLNFTLGRPGQVTIEVLDVQGRMISREIRGPFPAGPQSVPLDAALGGADDGLYFARVRVADAVSGAFAGSATTKVMKIR